MTLKVVVHRDDDGSFWAEVPALPGCATQGETFDELMANVREAIDGWLGSAPESTDGEVYEIAV
jgi:predicted RNase H-like HicB family nuclease